MNESKANNVLKEALDTLSNTNELPFDENTSYFKANLPASKALRIILFKLYLNILYYKDKLLESHDEEDLHQFRVNIRKSRAFIQTFSFLFQKELDDLLLTQLSKIATYTNKKRDLDVIKGKLANTTKTDSELFSQIDDQNKAEKEKIDTLLKSTELEHFLNNYKEALLQGEHLFINPVLDEKIKKSAKHAIMDLQENILKRIKKLEKKFSVKKLHKIRIAFKKLRYLLEEFQHLYNAKHISSDIKRMKDLQTLLGDFNDTINQKRLLAEYFEKYDIKEVYASHKELIHMTAKKEKMLIKNVLSALEAYRTKTLEF